jgi:hypothetical protein
VGGGVQRWAPTNAAQYMRATGAKDNRCGAIFFTRLKLKNPVRTSCSTALTAHHDFNCNFREESHNDDC